MTTKENILKIKEILKKGDFTKEEIVKQTGLSYDEVTYCLIVLETDGDIFKINKYRWIGELNNDFLTCAVCEIKNASVRFEGSEELNICDKCLFRIKRGFEPNQKTTQIKGGLKE